MAEDYQVQRADCINSIAFEGGFFWETLWHHASNASLKSKRKDPNVLMEGDLVHIPEITVKEELGATEQKHRFKRKGVPAKVEFVIRRNKKPVANAPYKAVIDDQVIATGKTDSVGKIKLKIPPNARSGTLVVGEGEAAVDYPIDLGGLDPVDEVSGLQDRLNNLGYFTDRDERGTFGPMTTQALKKFQLDQKLDATGTVNEHTQQKLKDAHGC
jgi:hypothetical protein